MTKELRKGLKKAAIFYTSIMFWIVLPTWIEAGLNILNAPAYIATSVFNICTYSSVLLVWVSFALATMCSSMFKVPVISLFIAEFFMISGWVFIWDIVETLSTRRSDLMSKRINKLQLYDADITFIFDD